ncbi:MAG: hypothetical protein QXW43_06110 [Candidatus Methanomethyliaceae archaeon]
MSWFCALDKCAKWSLMLYAGLGLKVPGAPFSVKSELRSLPVSKVKYYDITGEIRMKPMKPVYLSLGYRYEKLKIEKISDLYADVRIRGRL